MSAFTGITGHQPKPEAFEVAVSAAHGIIQATNSSHQVEQTVGALLEPLSRTERRIYLAGLLQRLAVDTVVEPETYGEYTDRVIRLALVADAAWQYIDPKEVNPWK